MAGIIVSDECAKLLATGGIIGQACVDYVEAKKELYRKADEGILSDEAIETINECLEFFRGKDFSIYDSELDPEALIKKLNRHALKDYYKELKTNKPVMRQHYI